jgi:hypothetical protein
LYRNENIGPFKPRNEIATRLINQAYVLIERNDTSILKKQFDMVALAKLTPPEMYTLPASMGVPTTVPLPKKRTGNGTISSASVVVKVLPDVKDRSAPLLDSVAPAETVILPTVKDPLTTIAVEIVTSAPEGGTTPPDQVAGVVQSPALVAIYGCAKATEVNKKKNSNNGWVRKLSVILLFITEFFKVKK